MPLRRLQISYLMDSALPRDVMVNNLHFNIIALGGGVDDQSLCNDLAAIMAAWCTKAPEIQVRSYDIAAEPPRFPLATAFANQGVNPPGSVIPREVALCLSFYGDRNVPRQRGRIFLPAPARLSAAGLRPTAQNMTDALDLADDFAGLGGANVDWIVQSNTANDHFKVSNAWVDDEWDTQRRRGLRPTTRQTRSVSG